ncbi:ORFS325W.iORF1 [Human betaherpesvirus 5]|nr:ORFS325W.iORF1 [Human betaherpesvirus 5]QHX40686.1 ORFS325W.iORF1 [Human betaherpesvirus 5]
MLRPTLHYRRPPGHPVVRVRTRG